MLSLTIDSNFLIYHLNGDASVAQSLETWFFEGDQLFISAVSRIELLAAPAMKPEEESKIQNLLSQFILVPVDAPIADIAARVRRIYKLKLGDGIIAATAVLTNSSLVTRNLRDFKKVDGLNLFKP